MTAMMRMGVGGWGWVGGGPRGVGDCEVVVEGLDAWGALGPLGALGALEALEVLWALLRLWAMGALGGCG